MRNIIKIKYIKYLFFLIIMNIVFCLKAQPQFPGTVVAQSPNPQSIYHASPSITILTDGSYLASHDWGGSELSGNFTSIYRSKDKGVTWQLQTTIKDMKWASLFTHKNDLYIMGVKTGLGDIVIRKSTDNGETWTEASNDKSGVILSGRYHTAPVPVVVHNGRIWRSFEESPDPNTLRDFFAFVLSADINADLLDAQSWTKSNGIRFDESWLNVKLPTEWIEGNIVVTPEGKIINLIRTKSEQEVGGLFELTGYASGIPRYEVASKIEISDDGKTASFNPGSGFIHFPGSTTKFTIRYDSVSKKYWSIVNVITHKVEGGGKESENGPYNQRNVLVLTCSDDLVHWEQKYKVARWNEDQIMTRRIPFGFQYADWQFDGNDIVIVSRTSWYGSDWHDANLITFHKINDFRTVEMEDSPSDYASYTQPKATLLSWQFSNPASTGSENEYISTFTHEQMNASTITRGAGLNPSNMERTFASSFSSSNNSSADAIANHEYLELKLCSKKDYRFSISTIDAKLGKSSNGARSYRWMYSKNGNNFVEIGSGNVFNQIVDSEGTNQSTVYVAGYKELQNLSSTDTVALRIYLWGATASGTVTVGRNNATDLTPAIKIGGNVEKEINKPTLLSWSLSDYTSKIGGVNSDQNHSTVYPSVLSRGSGFTPAGLSKAYNSNSKVKATKADAIKDDAYYTFDFKVKEGSSISLSALNVRLRRNTTGAIAYRWFYNKNDDAFTEIGTNDVAFLYKTNNGINEPSIDLSRIADLQNLKSTDVVSFRLYAWGATDSNGGFAIGIYSGENCLSLSGDIAETTSVIGNSKLDDEVKIITNKNNLEIRIPETQNINKVCVLDVNGKNIVDRRVSNNSVNISEVLPNGVYIVSIYTSDNKSINKKININ